MAIADQPVYPVTDRSRVRLFGGRGSNDKSAIHGVIDSALYGVVSYVIDGQPFATPTMVWRQGEYLYWHGSAGSRMLKHVAAGAEVCLNFTQLDGFVLSRLASAHTLNYRSVMAYGRTEPVESLEDRLEQLKHFLDSRFPGRWEEVKQPSLHELKSILMVRMQIQEGSLKRRAGPPADGLAIFGGEALYAQACWAGEVPLGVVAYPGRPGARLNAEVGTPDYVENFASQMGLRRPGEQVGPPPPSRVRVEEVEMMAKEVRRIRMHAVQPELLPQVQAGAHARVGVVLRDGTRDFRPYTVVHADPQRKWFDIAVLKENEGRGGSIHLHERVQPGDELQVEAFPNEFPVAPATASAVLVAGGIGVTPIVAIARDLQSRGIPFEVHYTARGEAMAAYRDELAALAGERFHFYDTARQGQARLAAHEILGEPAVGRHLYLCGPASLVDAVTEAAAARGYAADQIHHELFKAPPPKSTDKPVKVSLARSGKSLDVVPGTSILDAVLATGIYVGHSCKRGECGECAVKVVAGPVSHRDRFLSPAQRQSGLACICVAWSDSDSIVLDL
jgi:ferredoxin-NADP reductase/nitroimidazol reductase NimA-like FMN-containing flavoprotein (pyridoxamine 5'-phosphate oxidase superfamily)